MSEPSFDRWLTRNPRKKASKEVRAANKAREKKPGHGGLRTALLAIFFLAIAGLGVICSRWLGDKQGSYWSVPSFSLPVFQTGKQPTAADSARARTRLPKGLEAG